MSQFKVGDKVSWEGHTEVGTILKLSDDPSCNMLGDGDAALVDFAGMYSRPIWILFSQLELINRLDEDTMLPEYDFSSATKASDRKKLKSEELTWIVTTNEILRQHDKVGIKHDQDKPDLSLLPKEALEAMAYAFMHGEKKYGRYNFRAGMEWHRPLAAALRHITSFNEGEDIDADSNGSHLGHALAAIAMLIVYQQKGLGKDTRYKA